MLPQESNGDATPLSTCQNVNEGIDDDEGTDDDFQAGLGANNNDSMDAEPEVQPCVGQSKLPQSFAYPGFMHTIDQKWTAALLRVMDDINAPDYAFGLIQHGHKVLALKSIRFTHKAGWIAPAM